MRGRHTLAAICGALCLLLAGCGGSPEPKPPPKAEPSTSPSPSATPPVMPAAAKEKTKAGAEAFVRHYVALLNHAQATGEVDPMRAVESPSCKSCRSVQDDLTKLYGSGGHIEGGAWTLSQVIGVDPTPNGGRNVALVVTFGPQEVVRPEPAPAQHLKGGSLPLTMQLSTDPAGWRVAEWTRGR